MNTAKATWKATTKTVTARSARSDPQASKNTERRLPPVNKDLTLLGYQGGGVAADEE